MTFAFKEIQIHFPKFIQSIWFHVGPPSMSIHNYQNKDVRKTHVFILVFFVSFVNVFMTLRVSRLFPNLPISQNDIFDAGKRQKSHRSSGMQFLCADANFCSKSKLKSVCKPSRSVDIDSSRINLI